MDGRLTNGDGLATDQTHAVTLGVLRDAPTEILRAARDADRITEFVLALEKERLQAPEIQRPGTTPPRRRFVPARAGATRPRAPMAQRRRGPPRGACRTSPCAKVRRPWR